MKGAPITGQSPREHADPLPETADLVVIGGGVVGVTTAWFAAKKGLRVLLLEKGRIAGEQSSRNWGWIRQQGRDPAELPIMMEAHRLWKELSRETNEDIGLRQVGVTYLARSEKDIAGYEDWLRSVEGHGLDSRLLGRAEVKEMFPGAEGQWVGALHTASDLKAEPWVAVPALARAARREGVIIREGCAARGLDQQSGRVIGVVTESGRVACRSVVLAGGAWSSLFLRRHGVEIPQLSVRATAGATEPLPEVHLGGAVDDRIAFRRRADGGYTLAQGGFHELFVGPDAFRAFRSFVPQLRSDPTGTRLHPAAPRHYPDAWRTPRKWGNAETSPFERMRVLSPEPNQSKLSEMARLFGEIFPELGEVRLMAGWAGMIDTMPDQVPIADETPIGGLYLCTGLSGHGFGIGPGMGRIMADMATGGTTGHDLTRFRFGRFSDGSPIVLGPSL